MRYMLDTNIVSDLVRHPQGRIAEHVRKVGEAQVCTSIIVAAELRYGATKKGAQRLTAQLETVLGGLDVLPFEAPADAAYGLIRTRLEQARRSAATICSLLHTRSPSAAPSSPTTKRSSPALMAFLARIG